MKTFDDEIEKAVDRAGKTAGGLFALAVLTMILGILGMFGWGPLGFALALPGAGVLVALAVIVNLQAMHLMETWRQGQRAKSDSAARS